MNQKYIQNNYHIITFFAFYLTLIAGFFFDENVTGGPKVDFFHALKQVEAFKEDFYFTFFNYDKIEYPTRISPIFIMVIYFFEKLIGDIDAVRFVLLNFLILNQFFFYLCLKEYFKNKISDNKLLFIISCIIFISPSSRSNMIWPESAMFGLLFFLISVYFYLKFVNSKKNSYVYYNIFFLALSAYLRPSYSLFAIYFYLIFFINLKDTKEVIKITILNFLLASPAIFYIFFLDVFFISIGGLSVNYYNKIGVIASILFFHLIPILIYKNFYLKNLNLKKEIIFIFISIILSMLVILNFDYNLEFTGGGIILHFSNYILGNNSLFFMYFFFNFKADS